MRDKILAVVHDYNLNCDKEEYIDHDFRFMFDLFCSEVMMTLSHTEWFLHCIDPDPIHDGEKRHNYRKYAKFIVSGRFEMPDE